MANGNKPRGYWKNWNNVEREIKRIMGENEGVFPTQTFLKENGYSGLHDGIKAHHGGLNSAREKFGLEPLHKSYEQLSDWSWVKSELTEVIDNNGGDYPTQVQLRKLGRHDLKYAISKYHGGQRVAREKLGYEQIRIKDGHWKKWTNVRSRVGELEQQLGHFPVTGDFQEAGESGLYAGIVKYHGGLNAIREKMKRKPRRRNSEDITDWNWVESELKKVIKRNKGVFPSQKALEGFGRSDLANAMYRHHGGFLEVRERMGYSAVRRESGSLKDVDYIKKQFTLVLEEFPGSNEEFPSLNWMRENGFGWLSDAISRHHGGIHKFSQLVGKRTKEKPKGTWKDLDYCVQTVIDVIERESMSDVPSMTYLQNNGYGGLTSAISQRHGGMDNFRDLIRRKIGLQDTSPIRNNEQLDKFLKDNSEAKEISYLSSVTDNVEEIAEVLVSLWPERFPNASDLARSLPEAVGRIGASLSPFTLDKARDFQDRTKSLPSNVRYDLEDILYSIVVDQYQDRFNHNPNLTLGEIRKFASQKNGVSSLAKKVLSYYESVSEFEIPGYGKLEEAV
jgi:hypothetical protein